MAASITGTFTIIDRASGPMRKMEHQAMRTMAAIEGVGHAQDKAAANSNSAGRKFEDSARHMKNMESSAQRAGRGLDDVDRKSRRTGSTLDRLGQKLGSVNQVFKFFGSIIAGMKIVGLVAGFVTLAQGIAQVAGGLTALLPGLGQASMGIAALPQTIMAAVQGFGVFKAALSGVGAALKAGMQLQQQHTQVTQDYADQHIQAVHAVQSAEYGLMTSQRDVRNAQVQLTEARREAIRNLQDLRLAAIGADISQKRSVLSLREAQQTLADAAVNPQTTDLQMQGLNLDVADAHLQVRQAALQQQRAHQDLHREQKRGVNGNLQVVAATQALTDAVHQQKEAVFQLSEAQRALTRLQQRGTGIQSTFRQAMANLSPPAQAFVNKLLAMRPAIKSVQAAAAAGLFPGLGRAVDHLRAAIPMMRRLSGRTGAVMGNEIDNMTQRFTTPGRLNDIEGLGNMNTRIIGRMIRGFSNLSAALLDFMVAAKPFTDWLTRTIELGTRHVAMWSRSRRESGAWAAQLDRTKARLKQFWDILKNLGATMMNVFRAATPLGDRLWKGAGQGAENMRRWTSSAEGMSKMANWFDRLYAPLHALGQLTKDLLTAWAHIAIAPGFVQTINNLDKGVKPLEGLFKSASSTGPNVANTLVSIVKFFNDLPVSTLQIMLDAVTAIFHGLDWIIKHVPGAKYALSGLLLAGVMSKAIGLVGKLTSKWSELFSLWRRAPAAPMGPGGGMSSPGVFGVGGGGGGGASAFRTARNAGMSPLAASAYAYRMGGGLRGAGGLLSRGGRFVRGVAGLGGAIGFLTTPGDVGQRLEGGLSTATMGFIPGAPAQGSGQARAAGHIANLSPIYGPARIAALQRRIADEQGRAHPESGVLGQPHWSVAASVFGGRTPAQATQASEALKVYQAELKHTLTMQKQVEAERKRMLDSAAVQQAQSMAQSFGKAFGIYDKQFGGTKAMKLMTGDMFDEMHGMRKAGQLELAQQMIAWSGTLKNKSPAMVAQIERMKKQIIRHFHDMGQNVQIINGQILTGSRDEWKMIAQALIDPAERARQKVSEAFTQMQKMAVGSLMALGYKRSEAENIIANTDASRPGSTRNAASAVAQHAHDTGGKSALSGVELVQGGHAQARGGRIQGAGLQDTVPVAPGHLAAPGELIVNRHTEHRLNRMLMPYGTSLGTEVANENTPHWATKYARGGRYGGVTPALASLISQLDSRGFHHGSTTSGGHVAGSYHYKGMAVDFGDASNNMQSLWNVVFPMRSKFAELFGPSRLHPKPTLMHYGAGFSSPALQAGHENHIHIALTGGSAGALGAGAAGGAGAGAAIDLTKALITRPPQVIGGGAAGAAANAAIRAFQIGINRNIRRAQGKAGGGGGLGGFTGGGTARQNQILGHKMMLAAGWGESQWPALRTLWQGESGWNNNARNPSSGAYGIPQALGHGHVFGANPADQIRWGLNYIRGRYGSPSAALAAWQARSPHWYEQGGRVPDWGGWHAAGGKFSVHRPTMIGVGDGGKETVTVSRPGDGTGRTPVHVTIQKIENHREGDIKKHVQKELEGLVDDLDLVGAEG